MSIKPEQLTLNAAHIINWLNEQNVAMCSLEDENNHLKNRVDALECNLDNETLERQHFEGENKSLRQSLQDCEITRATILKERDELQRRLSAPGMPALSINSLITQRDEARRIAEKLRVPTMAPAEPLPWEVTAQPAPALCEDEGCPHYGTAHVCVTHPPKSFTQKSHMCNGCGLVQCVCRVRP